MEFFSEANINISHERLQRKITIDTLPSFCNSINEVLEHNGTRGKIYCIWGQFLIHRELINNGIRFTLPKCPNAFQWTITTDQSPVPDKVLVHSSINRKEHEEDLIESIEQFMSDWKKGLEEGLNA